jgi:hypothetical protein
MKKTIAVLIATVLLMLSGCSNQTNTYAIDNPTDTPLNVRIDQTSFDIAPHSAQELKLSAGRHTLESSATGKLNFMVYRWDNKNIFERFFEDKKPTLINPTLSPYILVSEVYAVSDESSKSFKPLSQTIVLDGVKFQGPFQRKDDLFIENQWTYGVHEDFPKTISMHRQSSKGNIVNKVFSKNQFVTYFELEQEQPGYYDKNKSPTPEPKRLPTPFVAEFPVFTDAQMQAEALKMKAIYLDYERAETAEEQQKLGRMWSDATMSILNVHSAQAYKAPAAENRKYNDLVGRIGMTFGQSARVIP